MPGVFYSDAGYPLPYYFPDKAEIQYDVWHDPRDTAEDCAREIEEFVGAMCQMDTWLRDHPPVFEWLRYYPPLVTDWNHPITQILRGANDRVAGSLILDPFPQNSVNFGAAMDGTWLQAAGVPSIVFGPGEVKIAHGRDEYVVLDEIFAAAWSLAVAARDWCTAQP